MRFPGICSPPRLMIAEERRGGALFHLFLFFSGADAASPRPRRRLRLVGNGTGAQKRPDAAHVSGGQWIHVGHLSRPGPRGVGARSARERARGEGEQASSPAACQRRRSSSHGPRQARNPGPRAVREAAQYKGRIGIKSTGDYSQEPSQRYPQPTLSGGRDMTAGSTGVARVRPSVDHEWSVIYIVI